MAMLTQAQIRQLAGLLDERHERERREIVAVTQRTREQALVVHATHRTPEARWPGRSAHLLMHVKMPFSASDILGGSVQGEAT